jgi:hypothetical protein
MTLDEFLERFVEGYLFEDLCSMAAIKLSDGQRYGAVGYPMVMTTLAGVELLGILTATKRFHPNEGDDRFREFWQVTCIRGSRHAQQWRTSCITSSEMGWRMRS